MDVIVDKVRESLCKLNESVKSSEINKFLKNKVRLVVFAAHMCFGN